MAIFLLGTLGRDVGVNVMVWPGVSYLTFDLALVTPTSNIFFQGYILV